MHSSAGTRSTEIESLRLRAALRREELELLPGFDALGHDPHVKTLSHADNRIDDAGIGGVDPDAVNEGLIDWYATLAPSAFTRFTTEKNS